MLTKKIFAVTLGLLLCGVVMAQTDTAEPVKKGFVMPDSVADEPAAAPVTSVKFKSSVHAGKARYEVGEPVQFVARGNRDFYLYVINISPSGETVFLYPREGERGDKLRADEDHTLPRNYNIVVDEPGRERVLMVSSLTPLDMEGARGILVPGGASSMAEENRLITEMDLDIVAETTYPFTVKTTPDNAVVKVMNITPKYRPGMKLEAGDYRLEVSAEGFETTTIVVTHSKDAGQHNVALKALVVQPVVIDSTNPALTTGNAVTSDNAVSSDSPDIVLSSEQKVYKDGDQVAVQYGASQVGWVHLYTYINGELSNVASKAVEAGKFYTLQATATEPHGEQILVALWHNSEAVDSSQLADLKAELAESNGPKIDGDSKSARASAQRALVLSVETPLNYKTLPLVINP